VRFAETIGVVTGGRIKIEVFTAGKFVRPLETFDAVGAGIADMGDVPADVEKGGAALLTLSR
jgi:TRAP-type mannitol/chloroaromatic compound transport system substrate-binding protein